jgi:hypothetical protein
LIRELLKQKQTPKTEREKADEYRDKKMAQQRTRRSENARVHVPSVKNPERRAACLADPELFLKTYNGAGRDGFTSPFVAHHKQMIKAIDERSLNGGDQAVAAPRGDGKSSIAIWMAIFIILSGRIKSLVIIAATRKHAQKLFKRIKKALEFNDLLFEDFPEICAPIRDLAGAPQRAAKQHVDGKLTQIVWTQDEINFPIVEGGTASGALVAYYGLDSAIRGGRFEFALIDDPETREVAFSSEQNRKVEDLIDGDVAGLAYPDSVISRVVLTTVQCQGSYSYRVTDPKIKSTFNGVRSGLLASWPEREDLWEEYIARRQMAQENGDKDGLDALKFYLENREEMNRGAEVTNPYRFNKRLNADGQAVEVDALQAFYNRVSDWGLSKVLAELQNDPEDQEMEQGTGLTAGRVQTQLSGLVRGETPADMDVKIAMGVDVGKYYLHWTKVAFFGNAIGVVIDYGAHAVQGVDVESSDENVHSAVLAALLEFREQAVMENVPDFCLVDSGDFTPAVYEFIRRVGSPWAASKGYSSGRVSYSGENTDKRRIFEECRADFQFEENVWLYNFNSCYWKSQVHQRFLTSPFTDENQRNDASLSLFVSPDKREHLNFGKHIVAEEYTELFVEGKGLVKKWVVNSKANHWLDSTALAVLAGRLLGVRIVPKVRVVPTEAEQKTRRKQRADARPANFRQRRGGWIPKRRHY